MWMLPVSYTHLEVRILVEAIEKARRSTLPLHEMFEQLMIDVGYIDMLKNDLEDNRIEDVYKRQDQM